MSEPQTFEQLFDFMASKVEQANGAMAEMDRAKLIADVAYEAAMFLLRATPSNGHHQMFLASELLKRLRNFHSPFFVISRQMGDADQLRKLFEQFISSTDGWQQSKH